MHRAIGLNTGGSFGYEMDYKQRRGIIGKFYKSKEWKKARQLVLIRDKFLCQHCGQPATEVHHKKHLTEQNVYDPTISLNPDNLVSLCWNCHRKEHQADDGMGRILAEQNPYEFDENGMLVQKCR